MRYLILSLSLLTAGCGPAPTLTVSASGAAAATTVTCPSGTSLVQGTTCEETAAHANDTQTHAAQVCANQEMHLCSIAERIGQWAHAPQEQAGVKYWLSDFSGGEGYVVEDASASPTTSTSFPYFCCVTGS